MRYDKLKWTSFSHRTKQIALKADRLEFMYCGTIATYCES